MKYFLSLLVVTLSFVAEIQADTIRALFLGNSYTAAHNLPGLISGIAGSCGDSLYYQSSTPGGYTFQMHTTNAQSIALIQQGGWDYLILQEQSQLPSFPDPQVETECFPYARWLDSIFMQYNPLGQTVFYRTWGRKNGDASNCPNWPPVCTYEGMDSILASNYRIMADSNQAFLCPAGEVWRYIRLNSSLELYDSDGSHPSAAGAMATALSFYSILFRKDPAPNTYYYTLTPSDYAVCLNAAQLVAFDSLAHWNVGNWDPLAGFSSRENLPFRISPNPACDFLEIRDFVLPAYPVYAEMYDGNGRQVKPPQRIRSTTEKLDIRNLKPGIYQLKLDQSTIHFIKYSYGL